MVDCVTETLKKFPSVAKADLVSYHKSLTDIKKTKSYGVKSAQIKNLTEEELSFKLQNRAMDILKKNDNRRFALESGLQGNDIFRSFWSGVSRVVEKGNMSYEALKASFSGQLNSFASKAIGDLLPEFRGGAMDGLVADLVIKIGKGESVSNFNKEAVRLATAVKSINDEIYTVLYNSGVRLKYNFDYFARQTHDTLKLRAVSANTWANKIHDKLDVKTFEGLSDKASEISMLEGIHDKIINQGIEGHTSNFSVGGKRSLHFKSGSSWDEYNKEFGVGTLLETVRNTLSSASKTAAISEKYGANAKSNYDDLVSFVGNEIKEGRMGNAFSVSGNAKRSLIEFFSDTPREVVNYQDFVATGRVLTEGGQRKAWEAEVFGAGIDPSGNWVARTLANSSLLAGASKLNLALMSTVTDQPISVGHLKAATDTSRFQTLNSLGAFFIGLGKEDKKVVGGAFDMFMDDLMSAHLVNLGIGINGTMPKNNSHVTKLLNIFMSATGLSQQSTRAKMANAKLFGAVVHEVKDKSFDELGPKLTATFKRYGIGSEDWEIIQKGTQNILGNNYISPDAIRALGATKRIRDAALKYSVFINDAARVGSPEATIIERAFINRGTAPSTVTGALLRMMGQFKSFTLAQPRVLNRIGQSSASGSNNKRLGYLTSVGSTVAAVTLLDMFRKRLTQGIRDKEGWSNFSEKDLIDSFTSTAFPLQLQITSDLLLSGVSGSTRAPVSNALKSVFGPTLGPAIFDSGNIMARLMKTNSKGETEFDTKTWIRVIKAVKKNLPGHNLPWENFITGDAIQRNTINKLYDWIEPGYTQRQKRRKVKRQLKERRQLR